MRIARGVHTIARFVEAMLGIAMARKNCHLMAPLLKADGGINNQAFSAANAQVWVEEDDMLRLRFFRHCGGFEAFSSSPSGGWPMTDCIPDVVSVVGHFGSLALAALGIGEG